MELKFIKLYKLLQQETCLNIGEQIKKIRGLVGERKVRLFAFGLTWRINITDDVISRRQELTEERLLKKRIQKLVIRR